MFHHAIAILHAPQYAVENAAALRQDWPRIPLPADRKLLIQSADLGRRVAALLDPESPVNGVTQGKVAPQLKLLGVPTKVGGGNFTDDDYAVTARWGIAGKGGITMPGKGKVVTRPLDEAERAALESRSRLPSGTSEGEWASPSGHGEEATESGGVQSGPIRQMGPTTCDIYLNDNAYWKNVPLPVWEYTLGGYQVLKKWLSYREESLLGRPLSADEVSYIRDVIRRIAALLLLGPELDANYAAVKGATYAWR